MVSIALIINFFTSPLLFIITGEENADEATIDFVDDNDDADEYEYYYEYYYETEEEEEEDQKVDDGRNAIGLNQLKGRNKR